MHKHKHDCGVCKHDCLHYCACCGKVYCCKCEQEWGGTYYSYYPYYPYESWRINYPAATTTTISTPFATTDTCAHSH